MQCEKCQSLCTSRTRVVMPDVPDANTQFRLLVVGEAPGAEEDKQGIGFVGASGRTLHALLGSYGLVRGKDYGCANVVRCRPADNRRPTKTEVSNCFGYLLDTISALNPKAVLAVGDSAASSFTGKSGLTGNISDLTHHSYNPNHLFERGSTLARLWPLQLKLFVIPHTSPLAWNRYAPDGRKWSDVGVEQIDKMVTILRHVE